MSTSRDLTDLSEEEIESSFSSATVFMPETQNDAEKVQSNGNTVNPMDWKAPIPFEEFHLPSFPTQALPSWLSDWVSGVAEETQTPPDIAAISSLAVLSTCCAGRITVKAKTGYIEPVNLYLVGVLPSGERKSQVLKYAICPLDEYTVEERKKISPSILAKMNEKEVLEKRLDYLQRQASKMNEDEERLEWIEQSREVSEKLSSLNIPAAFRLYADDVTPEKMAMLLSEHEGRMAVLSAEATIFNILKGRYSDGNSNVEIFLKGHSGETVSYDRVNRESMIIPLPTITMGILLQTGVLEKLVRHDEFRCVGFLARILLSLPKSMLGRRNSNPPSMPVSVNESYKNKVRILLSKKDKRELFLSKEAFECIISFQSELELHLGEDGDLRTISDWVGKLPGAIIRLSGLIHIAKTMDNSIENSISRETMENAVRLGKYFLEHTRAVFDSIGADPLVEKAKYILRWFRKEKQNECTMRDLHQASRRRFKNIEEFKTAIQLLESHNYVRIELAEANKQGRPASPRVLVNPCAHNPHNPHNTKY